MAVVVEAAMDAFDVQADSQVCVRVFLCWSVCVSCVRACVRAHRSQRALLKIIIIIINNNKIINNNGWLLRSVGVGLAPPSCVS